MIWDEAKRKTNLEKHGFDFADAWLVYENPAKVTFTSHRNNEARLIDIAFVEAIGAALTLVYMMRGTEPRAISLRFASREERASYEEAFQAFKD